MITSSAAPKITLSVRSRTRLASDLAQREETETEEKTCRLCFGDEEEGPLVQPCACRGSAKLIHKHCLERWRRTGSKEDAAYRCGQCRDEYRDALSLELLSARLQTERTDGEATISTLDTLASELQTQGKHDEAEPLYREVLTVERETLGNRHPSTLISTSHLGSLKDKGELLDKGLSFSELVLQRISMAKGELAEALEGRRETLGNRHPRTLVSIGNLSMLLRAKGDLAAVEPLLREALEVRRETLGNRHPKTLLSIHNLGLLLEAKGDLATAELLLRRKTLGNLHPDTSFHEVCCTREAAANIQRVRAWSPP